MHGWTSGALDAVTCDNVQITFRHTSACAADVYDLRPSEAYPDPYRHRIAGVYAKWATGLALRDVSVRWADDVPASYGPALEAEGVRGVVLREFSGRRAHAGHPAQLIDGVAR